MVANDSCALVNNDHDLIEILKAANRVIALIYASWCPFCVRFLPIFKKHAEKEGRHFVIIQDKQETIADKYSESGVLCYGNPIRPATCNLMSRTPL
jgi:thiol-disulfide isomerase/thioredoxin